MKFVVGLFDAVDDLGRALAALSASGLTQDRLCIIAPEAPEKSDDAVLARLPESAAQDPARVVVQPVDGGTPLRVVRGQSRACNPHTCDGRCAIDPTIVARFPHWVMGRQARQLQDQLMLGGTVLFVRVSDHLEQMAVGRTMLRHARNGVQTHDLVA